MVVEDEENLEFDENDLEGLDIKDLDNIDDLDIDINEDNDNTNTNTSSNKLNTKLLKPTLP